MVTGPENPRSESASKKLAAHVAGARFTDLPPEVVHAFKRALLDHVTCALAGASMPVSRALLSYYSETDAGRAATVIGAEARLSAPNAALVNGANTHGLDFDDGTTHGSANPDDQRVPLLFLGRGVKPGKYDQPATPADLAPTLAALVGVKLLKTDGHSLSCVQ